MSRLSSAQMGQQPAAPAPDIYTVLLLVSTLMMIWAGIAVFLCLTQDYGLSFGELFSNASIPQ